MIPNLKPIAIGLLMATAVSGCNQLPRLDKVLPDKRTEYRSARDLPPLEVPPDLTTNTINDSMSIPGEDTPNTLSAYERQQRNAASDSQLDGPLENEDQLTLRGDRFTIWPELKRFWQAQGYTLELDDVELGVLATDWSEPRTTETGQARDKFKVFAEPGAQENKTLLFISHDLQRRSGPESEWQDAGSEAEVRRSMTAALYQFFGGQQPAAAQVADAGGSSAAIAAAESRAGVPRAKIINNEQGQVYMTLPDEFETAWDKAETAIKNGGMEINSMDSDEGEFIVTYQAPQSEEDSGWFDALKFWKDDEPSTYRVSLTGLGESTELIVRDEEGNWLSDDRGRDILNRIQLQYNK